jgi:hypothetical protein
VGGVCACVGGVRVEDVCVCVCVCGCVLVWGYESGGCGGVGGVWVCAGVGVWRCGWCGGCGGCGGCVGVWGV